MKGNPADLTTPAMRARFGPINGAAAPPRLFAPPAKLPGPSLPTDAVGLGLDDNDRQFGIDLAGLLAGRLLVQGNSGAGKSWLLRKLLEGSAGRVQQIVLDPEHEFRSLAELLDYPIVEANRLDHDAVITLAERVRELRQNVVIDLSDLERPQQMMFVAEFLTAIIDVPEAHWHPAIVAIDEAHLFAPLGGQGFEGPAVRKRSTSAIVDLMSRGRKRGLGAVLATQRFARLSKSVASEAMNLLIGINTLDLDVRRAAETIGWDARRAFDRLPYLTPGEFVAVGPAFLPDTPLQVRIGSVRSQHMGATPAIAAPARSTATQAAVNLGLEELSTAGGFSADRNMPVGARAVRDFLRDPSSCLAGQLYAELGPLYPQGSSIKSLAAHFKVTTGAVTQAVALLSTFGAVETLGDPGPTLGVRISRSMRA